jgi:hypothetical protein
MSDFENHPVLEETRWDEGLENDPDWRRKILLAYARERDPKKRLTVHYRIRSEIDGQRPSKKGRSIASPRPGHRQHRAGA